MDTDPQQAWVGLDQLNGPAATDHLLGSPGETPTRPLIDSGGRPHDCTDLEHWFRTIGDARSSIIHGDLDAAALGYAADGSAYSGPVFHTAERLLREAIKVELTRLGHDRLYYDPTVRSVCTYLEQEGPASECTVTPPAPTVHASSGASGFHACTSPSRS